MGDKAAVRLTVGAISGSRPRLPRAAGAEHKELCEFFEHRSPPFPRTAVGERWQTTALGAVVCRRAAAAAACNFHVLRRHVPGWAPADGAKGGTAHFFSVCKSAGWGENLDFLRTLRYHIR
jgi:hypothetical protein